MKGKILGKGSFGTVYSVTNTLTKGLYALKEMPTNLTDTSSFERELLILSKLRHWNIVSLVGYYKTNDFYCIVTDLMDCSLKQVLDQRRKENSEILFTQGELIDLVKQVVEGLCYLHSQRIAHRDIKVHFYLFLVEIE